LRGKDEKPEELENLLFIQIDFVFDPLVEAALGLSETRIVILQLISFSISKT